MSLDHLVQAMRRAERCIAKKLKYQGKYLGDKDDTIYHYCMLRKECLYQNKNGGVAFGKRHYFYCEIRKEERE